MSDRTIAIHPGEVLLEVYMKPALPGLTVERLSQALQISPQSITHLINGGIAVTSSLATRLSVVCHTTPDYWLGLQRTYDGQTGEKSVVPAA